MTTLTEFLAARLDEDEAAAREASQAIGSGEWGHGQRQVRSVTLTLVAETAADRHIARHDPARVLREVAAKRRVLERHSPVDMLGALYCDGCPTDEDGYHGYKLSDCPELQNLAFIWNEHEDWDPRWCPHVEGRHEADVTEVPPARGCYTNACNRCGQGDGWHYRSRKEQAE